VVYRAQKAKQRKKVALGGMKGDATDINDPNLFGLSSVRGDKETLAGTVTEPDALQRYLGTLCHVQQLSESRAEIRCVLPGLSDAAAPGLIAASIAEREDGRDSSDEGEQRDEWDLESDATDSDADR
jgi:hypothetical protein